MESQSETVQKLASAIADLHTSPRGLPSNVDAFDTVGHIKSDASIGILRNIC